MSEVTEAIKKTLSKMDKEKFSEEDIKKQEEMLTKVFEQEILPKDAMGLPDELIEALYSQAYNEYQSGNYEPANHTFRLLVMLNPTDTRFSYGLGACYHMQKDYKNAIQGYMLTALFDPETPLPWYHMSDCYRELDFSVMKKAMLETCIEKIEIFHEDDETYSAIKERCQKTLEKLNSKEKK